MGDVGACVWSRQLRDNEERNGADLGRACPSPYVGYPGPLQASASPLPTHIYVMLKTTKNNPFHMKGYLLIL